MHNLGTVSASRLTSAPRLEYTKIHGLSICPYQNQSHFNRILKSYPLPPPKVPVSRRCRAPPHIPAPAHPPLVFYALFPAHTYARAFFANSPATAATLPPRYSPRKVLRSPCARAHSAYPRACSSTARFSHPAPCPHPPPHSLRRLRDCHSAPTAILPAEKCSESPPRPRALRTSPHPLICHLLSFPCTPPHPRPRALRISPHLLIHRPFFTSRGPPVSAPGLPPPAPRLLPRSHRDTPREKVLQIACPRRGYGVECLLLRRHSSVG